LINPRRIHHGHTAGEGYRKKGEKQESNPLAMIEMIHVSKTYHGNPGVLFDLSVKVDKGKFVYLIGPSGSGKTTFLKLLYAAERPTAGEIRVDEFFVSRLKRREIPYLRRILGVVFQDLKLLPRRTVSENVAFVMEVLGAPGREISKKTSEALQLVGIGHKGKYFPPQLSAGEQQRVAIARAIANNPSLLLIDEPMGNMGRQGVEGILQVFEEINLRGATLVLATQNDGLPAILPKEHILLERGRLVESSLSNPEAGSGEVRLSPPVRREDHGTV
jgi:cell division transport system ATP-binding protein